MRTPGGGPGTAAVIRLAARREVRQRLRARSFYLFTGLLVVAILAMGIVSRLTGDDTSSVDVGVVQPAPDGLDQALRSVATATDQQLDVSSLPDPDAARAALDDGDVDVAVVPSDSQVLFRGDVDQTTLALVQQAWATTSIEQNLRSAGLAPDQITRALTPPPLEARSVDQDDEVDGLASLAGTMAGVLLFISLQTFGGYVLVGVVEEKSSAVVELLLVRARADQLLAGKVLGIGAAALLQLATALTAALVSLSISGREVPGEVWTAVPMTLVWFLGGFALYSTLFALAGSLVSRQEDAQAASAPILTILVAAYFSIFALGYSPDSTGSRILSLIPPIAPLLMPTRIAAGAASVPEVVLALVLLLATTVLVWKAAGRVYEQVLLRRGTRISWRQALDLLRTS